MAPSTFASAAAGNNANSTRADGGGDWSVPFVLSQRSSRRGCITEHRLVVFCYCIRVFLATTRVPLEALAVQYQPTLPIRSLTWSNLGLAAQTVQRRPFAGRLTLPPCQLPPNHATLLPALREYIYLLIAADPRPKAGTAETSSFSCSKLRRKPKGLGTDSPLCTLVGGSPTSRMAPPATHGAGGRSWQGESWCRCLLGS